MKFYTNSENGTENIDRASIDIVNVQKEQGDWHVYLSIKSNQTGALKQSNDVVIIDAKNGKIKGFQKVNYG